MADVHEGVTAATAAKAAIDLSWITRRDATLTLLTLRDAMMTTSVGLEPCVCGCDSATRGDLDATLEGRMLKLSQSKRKSRGLTASLQIDPILAMSQVSRLCTAFEAAVGKARWARHVAHSHGRNNSATATAAHTKLRNLLGRAATEEVRALFSTAQMLSAVSSFLPGAVEARGELSNVMDASLCESAPWVALHAKAAKVAKVASISDGAEWVTIDGDNTSTQPQLFTVLCNSISDTRHLVAWRRDGDDVVAAQEVCLPETTACPTTLSVVDDAWSQTVCLWDVPSHTFTFGSTPLRHMTVLKVSTVGDAVIKALRATPPAVPWAAAFRHPRWRDTIMLAWGACDAVTGAVRVARVQRANVGVGSDGRSPPLSSLSQAVARNVLTWFMADAHGGCGFATANDDAGCVHLVADGEGGLEERRVDGSFAVAASSVSGEALLLSGDPRRCSGVRYTWMTGLDGDSPELPTRRVVEAAAFVHVLETKTE